MFKSQKRTIKRSFPTVLSIMAAVSLLGVADSRAEQQFSNNDLHGGYGFSFEGTIFAIPFVAVGEFKADGQGNFTSAVRTLVAPGLGLGDVLEQTATGTYVVSANGTGVAVFEVCTGPCPGLIETFHFVLVDNGKEAQLISTTSGVIARGVAKRQ